MSSAFKIDIYNQDISDRSQGFIFLAAFIKFTVNIRFVTCMNLF